jgi:hypothetical protein
MKRFIFQSVGSNLGITFGFLLLFLFSNSGSLGEFAVSLILSVSLGFCFLFIVALSRRLRLVMKKKACANV